MKPELHTFVGPYALGAVTDIERRRFERHLVECETCEQELRGLRETAARLGTAAAATPPDTLRAKVLDEVSRTRQLPPHLSRPHRGLLHGVSWIVAAACLILAVILGGVTINAQHRADQAQSLNQQVQTVLAAPDAHAATSRARPAGGGIVIASHSLGKAVVVMSGLPALPDAKTYQLWLMGPATPRSVGTMNPDHGKVPPVITGDLGTANQVGITIEPSGGSPQPTSPPVFTAPLA